MWRAGEDVGMSLKPDPFHNVVRAFRLPGGGYDLLFQRVAHHSMRGLRGLEF